MAFKEKFFLKSPFLLFFLLELCFFGVVVSKISLGSKLSPGENNSWISSNGDFALGFFSSTSDQPGQFSVGIRFNSKKIPVSQRTAVWVAGADITVSNSSYFQLTRDGQLVLFDSFQGGIRWASRRSESSVVSAQLRNDGNLVLLNEKKEVVWESFNSPSDTLVPGQKLLPRTILRAASRNSLSSYYSLYMNFSGELQLFWTSVLFWTSGGSSRSNLSAVLTPSGTLNLVNQNSEVRWSVFGQDHHEDHVKFRFLRLDVDGNLRMYSWINASLSWRSVWQAVENQCTVFATCEGRGVCAFNKSGVPVCQCPFRYPSDQPNSKCSIPSCKSDSFMSEHQHMFLYGVYPPENDPTTQTTLNKCKDLCRNDSSCYAVTYANDGSLKCKMMYTPYVSGYSHPSLRSISFTRVCFDPLPGDPNPNIRSPPSVRVESHEVCISCQIGVASATLFTFLALQFGIAFWIYKRRKAWSRAKASLAIKVSGSKRVIMFSLDEIKDLTRDFSNRIGPRMFKGVLPDKQLVVVKEVEETIEAKKFRIFVSTIGHIRHKSLLMLVGYCSALNRRFLVYEYAKHGSVKGCLEDPLLCRRLNWRKRMEICLSVGKAVSYLHTECRKFVSHGNLKCENVVLDETFEAKVGEYGFGMLLECETSSPAEKDVGDFGQIILAMVTGSQEANDSFDLVYKEWTEGDVEEVVDKRLARQEVDYGEVERALRIAFWCLQVDMQARPSMDEVVKMLAGTLCVDPPPPPFASRMIRIMEEGSSDSDA